MKIKSVEFENFRNFKEYGKIECSTDQRVTIIYGRNGDGKTTLHQLFQWVFYGHVHFNKTATDKLYNLQLAEEIRPGSEFDVMGRISFEHNGIDYTLSRTDTYEKNLLGDEIKFVREVYELLDGSKNWSKVDKPLELIETILPVGLSEYFFFDGETMIADLGQKSANSSKNLKKALYSIFDLDVLSMALTDIGATDKARSVLGKLVAGKGEAVSGSEMSIVQGNIENAQSRIEKLTKQNDAATAERDEKRKLVAEISEQIGSTKSKAEYERQRANYQKVSETTEQNLLQTQKEFGDAVIESYPKLLISKAILEASDVLKLKINSAKLPMGLGKTLINYLLSTENADGTCICGNPLCDVEREHIKAFLSLLPPKSYTNIYQEFIHTLKSWGKGYNKEKLENYIRIVISNNDLIIQNDAQIRLLDDEQKKSPDISDLVETRSKAEDRIEKLDEIIQKSGEELKKAHIYLKKQLKDQETLSKDDKKAQEALEKIRIMEAVRDHFAERLAIASETYSKKLQECIQDLLNLMMDNERRVSVSPDFALKVYDSFGDESKSEGQFAITSFAYIGGIFKMLQNENSLSNKEFPLVLDGPFSKLDPNKVQSVVDTIPRFAPQVIVFSKDDLQDIFSKDQIGRVWTIKSNVEQNVAVVKEGFLWK